MLASLEAENSFADTFKKMMSEFGSALLQSLKPAVEDTCQRVVEQVASGGGMGGAGEDDSDDDDDDFGSFGLTQIKSDKLVSIAPHDGMGRAAFIQDQKFIDSLKKGLASAGAKLKSIAGPLLEKFKAQALKSIKSFLSTKVGPVLRSKASELIQDVCNKAQEKMTA